VSSQTRLPRLTWCPHTSIHREWQLKRIIRRLQRVGLLAFHPFSIFQILRFRFILNTAQRIVSVALSSCQFRNRPRLLSVSKHQSRHNVGITPFGESPSILLSGLSSPLRSSLRAELWGAGPYLFAFYYKGLAHPKLFAKQRAKEGEDPASQREAKYITKKNK